MEQHLAAAAAWLARAQDATPDDGVAHSYDLKLGCWHASYPETTGYIIPTLYDYAQHYQEPEYAERALRMARWEAREQLPDGGVRAGRMDAEVVVPTIFNTGQVLFGWTRAWIESGDETLRMALVKGADWLMAAQDADGCWRRFSSPFSSRSINPYNTRSAFALAQAGVALGKQHYIDAAVANVTWALGTAQDNGWIPDNCLSEAETAIIHTIAYTIRGFFEVGVIAGREEFIACAHDMAREVASNQRQDGSLPGSLTPRWQPGDTRSSCVTGNSQMAINWMRLSHITGDKALVEHAHRINCFNRSLQDLTTSDPGIRGAMAGSYPINGDYMRFRYPNWATKFFMDGLMLEINEGRPLKIIERQMTGSDENDSGVQTR